MSKVFRITPKHTKRTNGQVLTPDMSITVTTRSHTTTPFYNGAKEIQEQYMLCSSIIVEPIAFSKDGIGNPGGVYRRTISRYDKGYGIKLFQKILTIGNIKPAVCDENGNWL